MALSQFSVEQRYRQQRSRRRLILSSFVMSILLHGGLILVLGNVNVKESSEEQEKPIEISFTQVEPDRTPKPKQQGKQQEKSSQESSASSSGNASTSSSQNNSSQSKEKNITSQSQSKSPLATAKPPSERLSDNSQQSSTTSSGDVSTSSSQNNSSKRKETENVTSQSESKSPLETAKPPSERLSDNSQQSSTTSSSNSSTSSSQNNSAESKETTRSRSEDLSNSGLESASQTNNSGNCNSVNYMVTEEGQCIDLDRQMEVSSQSNSDEKIYIVDNSTGQQFYRVVKAAGTLRVGEQAKVDITVEARGSSTDNITYGVLGTDEGEILAVERMGNLGSGSIMISTEVPAQADGNNLYFKARPVYNEKQAIEGFNPPRDEKAVLVGQVN